MSDKLTYLAIDIGAFLIPFIFSFHYKINFYKEWRAYIPSNLIITFLFLIWDALYTHLGVWGFNERYILGYYIFGLPIEEILFFLCIPYSSLFTYHCFKIFFPQIQNYSVKLFTLIFIIALFIGGIVTFPKLYTCVTFFLLAITLLFLILNKNKKWMPHFYFMYLIIIIPFFIVNGILTGTGLDEEVVWYNNNENLGFRLLTIPIEDVFYGMLLLILNTFLFEKFQKSNG